MTLLKRPAAPDDPPRLARLARNHRHDARAHEAYGLALFRHDRGPEGLAWITRAADLDPGNAGYWVNLGTACFRLGRYEESLRASQRAYDLDPGSGAAAFNLAVLHLFWADAERAARWYRTAADLDPGNFDAWSSWIFCLDLLPGTTPSQALEARCALARQWEEPLRGRWPRHQNDPDPDRRIRLGFLGGDFRDHSASYCFGPIYDHLDRDRFEVFTYADQAARDHVTDWFEAHSDGWRDVAGRPDDAIARAVRFDRVDILVDPAGYTRNGHLLVHMQKPAPLSVTAWGNLAGTGLSAMDGMIADAVMIPPGHEGYYRERVLRVPYGLGFSVMREDVPILPRMADRPLTFGHLGRAMKVSAATLALWAGLLRAHPGSRLILKDDALQHERPRARLLEGFAAGGVGADRIEMRLHSPRADHLAVYNEIDVALDTSPQGGGMTTLEALWMGTPTVTLLGDRIVGRYSASALQAVGHPEWVARDEAEYVRIPGRIGGDGGPRLRAQFGASPICDDAGRTRAFEGAIRGLWGDWCARAAGRVAGSQSA